MLFLHTGRSCSVLTLGRLVMLHVIVVCTWSVKHKVYTKLLKMNYWWWQCVNVRSVWLQ